MSSTVELSTGYARGNMGDGSVSRQGTQYAASDRKVTVIAIDSLENPINSFQSARIGFYHCSNMTALSKDWLFPFLLLQKKTATQTSHSDCLLWAYFRQDLVIWNVRNVGFDSSFEKACTSPALINKPVCCSQALISLFPFPFCLKSYLLLTNNVCSSATMTERGRAG